PQYRHIIFKPAIYLAIATVRFRVFPFIKTTLSHYSLGLFRGLEERFRDTLSIEEAYKRKEICRRRPLRTYMIKRDLPGRKDCVRRASVPAQVATVTPQKPGCLTLAISKFS